MQCHLIQQTRPVIHPWHETRGFKVSSTCRPSSTKDGKAKSATLIEGHPLLAPAALDAVKKLGLRATLFNGEPQRSRRCKRHGVISASIRSSCICRNDCTTIPSGSTIRMIRRTPIRRCAQQRQRG